MCVYSAVVEDFRRIPMPQYPIAPNVPTPQPKPWDRDSWETAKEILERVKELDRKLDQPDCDEVPKKEWMDEIERRLDEIEAAQA